MNNTVSLVMHMDPLDGLLLEKAGLLVEQRPTQEGND